MREHGAGDSLLGAGLHPAARIANGNAKVRPFLPIARLGSRVCLPQIGGLEMASPTPEAIENARLKVQQAKARLQALEARAATLSRKADARRKIILGGLILDAARTGNWPSDLADLMDRISRDHDRRAFEGWSLTDG